MSAKRLLEDGKLDEHDLIPRKKTKQSDSKDPGFTRAEGSHDSDASNATHKTEANKVALENIRIATGQNETSYYKYIDTENKFHTAMAEINNKIDRGEMIAVDCEGVDLSRFGSITMINIALRNQVYLIDVMAIGDVAYDRGLRSLLENASIEKLMFDCREDADALCHLHNVKLNGVLDIQLLEVMDRIRQRGYTTIKSLKRCLELFIPDVTLLQLKLKGSQLMLSSNRIWEKRPIDEMLLKYGSADVIALFHLYDALSKRAVNRTRWREASARYCSSKRSKKRTYRDGDGRLPSGIF